MDGRSPSGFLGASKSAWDRTGFGLDSEAVLRRRLAGRKPRAAELSRWSGLNWQEMPGPIDAIPNTERMLCGVDGGQVAQIRRRALPMLIAAETRSVGAGQVPSRESYTGGIMGTLPWLGCVVWCGVV